MSDIITDIMLREGWDKMTNDPLDGGGRTQFGISEKSNPDAWKDGKVTEDEARAIYHTKYVTGPGFDKITNYKLRSLMVDFAVTSGPSTAIKYLQRALNVKDDGILGTHTLQSTNSAGPALINKVVAERIKMICRIVVANPSQTKFLVGWINRCCEWL